VNCSERADLDGDEASAQHCNAFATNSDANATPAATPDSCT